MARHRRLFLALSAVLLIAAVSIVVIQSRHKPAEVRPSDTYYVSTSGDDAGDGTSAKPWRTIQKAVDTAQPGATIYLRSGSFAPFKVNRPKLTITAAPDQYVTIDGQDGVRDNAWLAADDVTLSNVTVQGCRPHPNQGTSTTEDSTGVRIEPGTTGVTVSGLTVRDSHGTNAQGHETGCYGIVVRNATDALIDRNDIYHNGFGVAVVGGRNTRVTNNRIHDNDVIIRDSPTPDYDDYGAVAIGFINVQDGAVAEGNTLYGNQGHSFDFGTDGGAFDIYQSSNITMARNLIANNDIVLETGTSPGGECLNNKFENNIAWGPVGSNAMTHATGFILRCAREMTITNNHLNAVDSWIFQITGGGNFGGSVTGLSITGNTVAQEKYPIYQFDVDPAGTEMTIDHNAYRTPTTFALDWHSRDVASLGEWQHLTGFDAHSTCECGKPGP